MIRKSINNFKSAKSIFIYFFKKHINIHYLSLFFSLDLAYNGMPSGKDPFVYLNENAIQN